MQFLLCYYILRMTGTNSGVCHSCKDKGNCFRECLTKRRCLHCNNEFQSVLRSKEILLSEVYTSDVVVRNVDFRSSVTLANQSMNRATLVILKLTICPTCFILKFKLKMIKKSIISEREDPQKKVKWGSKNEQKGSGWLVCVVCLIILGVSLYV